LEFSQRITGSYPEVFNRGITEGNEAENYFKDFGWYPTFKKLAKNDILKIEEVGNVNVHEALMFLACDAVENKVKIEAMKQKPTDKVRHL
jgi:hypothetical protein